MHTLSHNNDVSLGINHDCISLIKNYGCVCVCMMFFGAGVTHAHWGMWKPKNNSVGLVLFFHLYVSSRRETQLPGFPGQVSLLAESYLSFCDCYVERFLMIEVEKYNSLCKCILQIFLVV